MTAERTFRQRLLGILGISSMVVMVAIDQTIVSTALPTIVADLAGFGLYAWVATAYLLMSVITIPIFGRLGDFYGRKPLIMIGIVVFALASLLCAFASSMLFLVFARALQGIGAGMLIGTAFASIPDLFPDPHVRLRWQVVVSSSFGVANAIGPSLGGFMTHAFGWRSVFYVNIPVGLVGLFIVYRFLPHVRHVERGTGRIDWLGAALITVALGSFQLLLQFVPRSGFTAGVAMLAVVCVAAAVALVWCERRSEQPLLPLAMFADKKVGSLAVLALFTGFCMFTMLFYVPLMLQGGFGLTANESGLLVTPLVVCITFGSILNGRLVTRIRAPNVMLSAGFALLTVSFAGMAMVDIASPRWLIVLCMVLGGVGLGFLMPNLTLFAQESVPRSQLGIVTAMLQSVRMIGGMIGTAAVGALVSELHEGGVHRSASAASAESLEPRLLDPQILVSESARQAFMHDAGAAGVDGAALIEGARSALTNAIRWGLGAGAVAAMIAVWRVRAVPLIRLARRPPTVVVKSDEK
jgi:EmrB/QacA subfamily drug resistance transporter